MMEICYTGMENRRMKKKYKIGCISFVVLVVIALIVFNWIMFGDHSSFESGLAKYEYLPDTAHDITVYTNLNISGTFICDFSMKEEIFKDFAKKQDWKIKEIKFPEYIFDAYEFHKGNTHKKHQIKSGLYYSKRADNGGGITVGYDRDNGRGYINKSSR